MKITVDLEGVLSQIQSRTADGFHEGVIYFRIEHNKVHESKSAVYLRVSAVVITGENSGMLLECVEDCGIDYNSKFAGTEAAHKKYERLAVACALYKLRLLSGRIEMQ